MSWQAPQTATKVSFPGPSGKSCASAGNAITAAAITGKSLLVDLISSRGPVCACIRASACRLKASDVKARNAVQDGGRHARPIWAIIDRAEILADRARRHALRTLLLADHPGARRVRPPGAGGGGRRLCRRRAPQRR